MFFWCIARPSLAFPSPPQGWDDELSLDPTRSAVVYSTLDSSSARGSSSRACRQSQGCEGLDVLAVMIAQGMDSRA